MKHLKLLAIVYIATVLQACIGEDSLKNSISPQVSAELLTTLPRVNDFLSTESPEGIWRIVGQSRSNSKADNVDMIFEMVSEQLIVIKKMEFLDPDIENNGKYVIYGCVDYLDSLFLTKDGSQFFYEKKDETETSLEYVKATFQFDDNLSFFGQRESNYKYTDSISSQKTFYSGVKVSDAKSLVSATELNASLVIKDNDSTHQLSDYSLGPTCLASAEFQAEFLDKGQGSIGVAPYKISSSSIMLRMDVNSEISFTEQFMSNITDSTIQDHSYSSSLVNARAGVFSCLTENVPQGTQCLENLSLIKSVDQEGMNLSARGESISGEFLELEFSYDSSEGH